MDVTNVSTMTEKNMKSIEEDKRIAYLMQQKVKHENITEKIKVELRKIMYNYDRKI